MFLRLTHTGRDSRLFIENGLHVCACNGSTVVEYKLTCQIDVFLMMFIINSSESLSTLFIWDGTNLGNLALFNKAPWTRASSKIFDAGQKRSDTDCFRQNVSN